MIVTGWILLMILVQLQILIFNVQKQLALRINKLDSYKKSLKMKEGIKKTTRLNRRFKKWNSKVKFLGIYLSTKRFIISRSSCSSTRCARNNTSRYRNRSENCIRWILNNSQRKVKWDTRSYQEDIWSKIDRRITLGNTKWNRNVKYFKTSRSSNDNGSNSANPWHLYCSWNCRIRFFIWFTSHEEITDRIVKQIKSKNSKRYCHGISIHA